MSNERSTSAASPDLDLDAAATSYDIPGGDVARVVRHGRHLAARRRRFTASATAMLVLAGAFAVQDVFGRDPDREVPLAADGTLIRGPVGISWRMTTPEAGIGFGSNARGPAPLYALSTAAGERDFETARRNGTVWRSENGVDWVAASTLAGDFYLADLAGRDGRVYAVGTTTATAVPGTSRTAHNLVAGWSDDDGKTFSHTALSAIDLAGIAQKSRHSGVGSASVASGPRGTMIVATVQALLDVPELLPAGVTAPNGWVTTESGIDLLGGKAEGCPDAENQVKQMRGQDRPGEMSGFRCYEGEEKMSTRTPQEIFGVAARYSFGELGIGGDLLLAVQRQPVVFFAPPGTTDFERVEMPHQEPMHAPVLVEAHDDGFDVVAASGRVDGMTQKVVALHSADGRAFEAAAPLPDIMWPTAIGRVRGVTTVVGGTERGSVVAQRKPGGHWTSSALSSAVAPDAAAGKQANAVAAGIGDFGIVVAVVLSEDGQIASTRIVASRDGTTWEDSPLDALVDEPVRAVTRIVVTDKRAVVTVGVGDAPRSGAGPLPQRALIAVAT